MKVILLIAGLIFAGIGTGLFYLMIKPSLDAKNILENGVETSATLIGLGSNVSKGSDAYYWLKLSFVNSESETITYKTKSLYPQSFIKSQGIAEYNKNTNRYVVTEEPVLVMYLGDKAVIKEFVPVEHEEWTNWLAPGIFGGIGVLILLGMALAPVVGMFPFLQQLLALIGFIFIGGVFAGVGAGVYFWVLQPPMEAAKILKKGVETTATVIEAKSKVTSTTKSGSSSSTKALYYLNLSFVNAKGETITYKTNSMYDKYFLRKMNIATEINSTTGKYDEQQVQVMCLGAKAVVKEYVPEKTETFLWLFPIVFGAIGVAFWLALLWGIVKTTNDYIIKTTGAESTGVYVKHEEMTVNNEKLKTETPACNIFFTYENQNGEIIEAQTGYLLYHVHEAEALAAMGRFPVKYRGKKAMIMVDGKALQNTR